MKIACVTYSDQGKHIADKMQKQMPYEVTIFTPQNVEGKLCSKVSSIFKSYEGIVFICAVGIAVRVIAPHIKHKMKDPAVVVVDDLGRFSISLLSGHVGGANQLAEEVSVCIGAKPIITTASDGRGIEAIDMFAKRNNLKMENLVDAKNLTAMMIREKKIKLISDRPITIRYPHIVDDGEEGRIYVSPYMDIDRESESLVPYCVLRPRCLYIGLGCRKGKSKQSILDAIKEVLDKNNLSIHAVKAVATIEAKKDEPGIIAVCKQFGWELKIFQKEEIDAVAHQFTASAFVHQKMGVTAVSEPCAHLAGGKVIVPKTAIEGVTVAIAKENDA